jgi:sporulation protein YlmC with PRC-barrel domain
MTAESGSASPGDSLEPAALPYRIGAEVLASDGPCGELTRVIIDPVARALTHLVVRPKGHQTLGRLVPVDLVEPDGGEIRLRCTIAELDKLDEAEESQVLPASDYPASDVFAWPYYGAGGMGMSGAVGYPSGLEYGPIPVVSDRVPVGDVEVRRGDQVHASDGWIGSVQGLVVDPKDHHVTHVLLQEGHLWGRKQVAIPIGAVTRMEDAIRVSLTKQQVQDLPPVELESKP